jgi:hypothetical protein
MIDQQTKSPSTMTAGQMFVGMVLLGLLESNGQLRAMYRPI